MSQKWFSNISENYRVSCGMNSGSYRKASSAFKSTYVFTYSFLCAKCRFLNSIYKLSLIHFKGLLVSWNHPKKRLGCSIALFLLNVHVGESLKTYLMVKHLPSCEGFNLFNILNILMYKGKTGVEENVLLQHSLKSCFLCN